MQLRNIKATINYLSFLKMLQAYGTHVIHGPRINTMIQMEQNTWLFLLEKWFIFPIKNHVFQLIGHLIFIYFLCFRSYTGNWIDIEIIHLKIFKLFMRSWKYNVSEPKLFPKWNEKTSSTWENQEKNTYQIFIKYTEKINRSCNLLTHLGKKCLSYFSGYTKHSK